MRTFKFFVANYTVNRARYLEYGCHCTTSLQPAIGGL